MKKIQNDPIRIASQKKGRKRELWHDFPRNKKRYKVKGHTLHYRQMGNLTEVAGRRQRYRMKSGDLTLKNTNKSWRLKGKPYRSTQCRKKDKQTK